MADATVSFTATYVGMVEPPLVLGQYFDCAMHVYCNSYLPISASIHRYDTHKIDTSLCLILLNAHITCAVNYMCITKNLHYVIMLKYVHSRNSN